MKQQYNKLWFIKKKKLMKQQYIWEKFLKPPLGKIMLLKEHPGKNSWSRHWLWLYQNNIFYGRPDGDALNPLSILCIRKCLGMGVSHTIEGRAFL